MIARLRSLIADERATSMIELALLTPLLASFLVGMIDISRAYAFKLDLEQSVQRSIEKVMQYQESTSTYSTLKSEAASAAGVPVTAVTLDFWLECGTTRQADYDSTCTSGPYARFVTVAVTKPFTPMFGSRFFPGANADGTYTIKAKAGLRTQ
jgi:Flp pilus assembly protein TadG